MRVMCALLGMAASAAFAGGPHTSQDQHQGQTQDQAQSQSQYTSQQQGQTTVIGDTSLTGGTTSVSGGNMSIQSRTVIPYQAPGVYTGAPRSTAPMLKCLGAGVSLAGTDGAGGGTGAWCWIVRPIWYEYQADKYRSEGLWEAAASARCMDRLQWKPFGSKKACLQKFQAEYKPSDPDTPSDPEVIPTSVCDKKVARCEAAAIK